MEHKIKLIKNINKNYFFVFLRNMSLTHGLWMIYLASKGMSLLQLGLLEGIFHVSSFLMEVPTGMIADVYSRKVSRIMGGFLTFVSTLLLIVSDDFYMFAGSFVLSALSYNLESGAGDALIYDSLKELDEEDKYMKINGRNEMFFQIGSIVAFPIAGFLADISFDIVFLTTAAIDACRTIFSFSFEEPHIGKIAKEKLNPFVLLSRQLKESIKVLRSRKRIGFLIIFLQVVLTFITTMFFYLQNYWTEQSLSRFDIGVVYCAGAAFGALSATVAYKVEKRFGERLILLFIPALVMVCIWGIALTELSRVFYVIMSVAESMLFVVAMDYINKMIPSENRATILSMASMVFSLLMIVLFPVVGRIGDVASLKTAFIFIAVLGTVMLLINGAVLLKEKRQL